MSENKTKFSVNSVDEPSYILNNHNKEDVKKINILKKLSLKNMKPEKRKKLFITLGAVLVAFAIVFAIFESFAVHWRNGDKVMPTFFAKLGFCQGASFEFFDGITINGVNVNNMSMGEAKRAIAKAEKEKLKDATLQLSAAGKTFAVNGNDLVFTVETGDGLKEAKQYCIDVMLGKQKKLAKTFTTRVTVDKKAMAKIFEEAAVILQCEPVDATFNGIDASGIKIVNEINGVRVNPDCLAEGIETYIASGATDGIVTINGDLTPPAITAKSLQGNIQLLGSFSTTSTTTYNATENMRKAMKLCDGSVIAPNEIWSFNARTGNSNVAADGWLSGAVIIGGQMTTGYGGGICQASTTIYNAALYANLGIYERHCHHWPSSYAKKGLDATIDYPGLDLKLQNNSNYPIYLQCIMEGRKLTVNFYGYQSPTYDEITMSTETVKYVAGEYYVVNAYRILWKDGVKVKTEQLPSSKYSLKSSTSSSEESSSSDPSEGSSSDISGGTSSIPPVDPNPNPNPNPGTDPALPPEENTVP